MGAVWGFRGGDGGVEGGWKWDGGERELRKIPWREWRLRVGNIESNGGFFWVSIFRLSPCSVKTGDSVQMEVVNPLSSLEKREKPMLDIEVFGWIPYPDFQ